MNVMLHSTLLYSAFMCLFVSVLTIVWCRDRFLIWPTFLIRTENEIDSMYNEQV